MKNQIIENLDKVLKEFMSKNIIPGLAVGVVYDNEVIYTKGFGAKNIETKEPINEYSLFHMASVSKTFVATGIMQLVQKGKIKLNSLLTEYLTYFQLKDDRYKKITIRQLLSHISGMPDEEDYEWDKPQYDEGALERYVRNIKGYELMWEPGEKFAYSNIAFEILGDVIAKVSGVSFEDYMKENILNVLEMKESNFLKPLVSKELLTTPHILDLEEGYRVRVSEVFPYNRAHGPSSTLCSNVVELCNYAIANMGEGRFKGAKILEPQSYLELWRAQAVTGWGGYTSEVGLAWFLGEYKGIKVKSHSGRDTGFLSNLVLLPEIGAAVVMMTNSDYVDLNNICSYVMNIVLGNEVESIKDSLAHHILKTVVNNNFEIAVKEYYEIKENSIEEYLVIEGEFNSLAYRLLGGKRIKKAIELLKISVVIFPQSSNLHDSLGEIYLISGDKELAIESYRKSVQLNPKNIRGNKILEKLICENN
ncbi:serine hydrolase [Clostridium estertheticum]|uniref:serine hydrolase domain-containing protein n=1 Tax=Clostridium estertheticum TaxID=238834 RepID=UPI001CD1445C|nr:serine hydrolase domain-containing protein [Clostridium estertheticum]MBZ9688787.1 serine hydrolase [Clostridium estertheticum]